MTEPSSRARTAGVVGAAVVVLVVAAALAAAAQRGAARLAGPGPASLDDAVVTLAGCVGAAVAAWLAVAIAVSLGRIRCGRSSGGAMVPATLHRLVGVALGLTLVGAGLPAASAVGSSGPAAAAAELAAAAAAAAEPTAGTAPPEDVDPGWTPAAPAVPGRVAAPADPLVVATPRAGAAAEVEVVVRRGDTLWDIAARHLPAGASDAEIAAAWPAWYSANAAEVGADPDLLLPGQVLSAPQSPQAAR